MTDGRDGGGDGLDSRAITVAGAEGDGALVIVGFDGVTAGVCGAAIGGFGAAIGGCCAGVGVACVGVDAGAVGGGVVGFCVTTGGGFTRAVFV